MQNKKAKIFFLLQKETKYLTTKHREKKRYNE